MIELVGLEGKADRPIKGFSGGERQRLGIAQAEINYPDLLILDEPAASLDPQGRRDVLDLFLAYVLTALQLAEDDLGQAALEVVENTREINLQRILGLLIDDLYDLDQPIVLVLDDYHLLTEAAILEAMEFLPHHQPRQFRCGANSIPKMAVLERLTCHLANPTENTNASHN